MEKKEINPLHQSFDKLTKKIGEYEESLNFVSNQIKETENYFKNQKFNIAFKYKIPNILEREIFILWDRCKEQKEFRLLLTIDDLTKPFISWDFNNRFTYVPYIKDFIDQFCLHVDNLIIGLK